MFIRRSSRSWIGVCATGVCATLLIACGDSASDPVEAPEIIAGPNAAERLEQLAIARKDLSGEQLARIHCQSCHAFPDPDSFDKATWTDKVFPLMGPRLGIYVHGDATYRDFRKESKALAGRTDLFPDAPQLTGAEWQKLMDWYVSAAPDQPLPQDEHAKITVGLKHFEVKFPPRTDKRPAMTTVVKIDPVTGNIYLGNAMTNNLIVYDKHFKVVNTFELKSPPSTCVRSGKGPKSGGSC